MTTVKIDIPDGEAARLAQRAAAQGLSLEDYFRSLVRKDAGPMREDELDGAVNRILELQKNVVPDPDGLTASDYMDRGRP